MSNLCVPLEVSKIEQALLPIINVGGNEFWLKDVKKATPESIIGTTLLFQNKNNPKKTIKIYFGEQNLVVNSPHSVKLQIIDAIMRMMQEVCEEIKYDKILNAFEPYIKQSEEKQKHAHILSLLSRIVDQDTGAFAYNHSVGGLKTNKFYEKALQAAVSKNAIIDCGGHFQRIVPFEQNPYNSPNREIKHKEIYYIDLNPVYDGEFGGRRPCVILYDTEDDSLSKNYYVVPCTHSNTMANGVEIGMTKHQAVVNKVRLVSPERIYEKYGELSDEQYLYLISQTRKVLRYYSPEEGEVKALQDLTKKEIKIGEEYGKEHTVDYQKLMNEVKIPEQELKKLVFQRIALFSKFNYNRDENGALDFKVYKNKECVKYVINEKSYSPTKPQITFTFYKFNVKMEVAGKSGSFDPALTAMYYSMMQEKYQNYDIMSVITLAVRLNIRYASNTKANKITDMELYMKNQTVRAEKELACWNLTYDDIPSLILMGQHAFMENKLHQINASENEGDDIAKI